MFKLKKAAEADAYDIAKVQVDSWRTTYKGIVSDDYLSNLSYKKREEVWELAVIQNTAFLLESDDGEIVGFAIGGPERSEEYVGYDGELYAIYLYEHAQGKGGGSMLFDAVVEDLLERGFENMIIAVLEDNPACEFYERMGGVAIAKEEISIGGSQHTELVYGWENIKEL